MRAKTLVLIGFALAAFMLAPLILAAPGAEAARRVSVAQTPRRQRSAPIGVVPPTSDQYACSSVYPLVLHPLRSAVTRMGAGRFWRCAKCTMGECHLSSSMNSLRRDKT